MITGNPAYDAGPQPQIQAYHTDKKRKEEEQERFKTLTIPMSLADNKYEIVLASGERKRYFAFGVLQLTSSSAKESSLC